MKNYLDKLPEDVFNKIMLYNTHPVSDMFKKELEEELNEHYRILIMVLVMRLIGAKKMVFYLHMNV